MDLVGKKFGKLTVIKKSNRKDVKHSWWICQCACGCICEKRQDLLVHGKVEYCNRFCDEKYDDLSMKNVGKQRLHNIWSLMKSRCYNKNNKSYHIYGGRGISVCDEWKNDYECFKNWAESNGYSDELTIDRIDVNGNYEPNNCRWITIEKQQNNRRNNKRITIGNSTHTIAEWSKISGVSQTTIWARIFKYGWNSEKSVFTPAKQYNYNR